ncbi:MAG TPA: chemotaxis protein CheW [Gemmatimonadales bacterium]|nr:chemotaxis protein CheW [Gemmatimonadales bacterium]
MSATQVRYLELTAGGRRYGLPVAQVVEVGEPGPVLPAPAIEPAIRGVTEARGALVPVLHLAAFLVGAACPAERGTAVVLIRPGGRGDRRLLALEVDDVFAVVRGPVLPAPSLASLPWATGLAQRDDGTLPILDLSTLADRLRGIGAPA